MDQDTGTVGTVFPALPLILFFFFPCVLNKSLSIYKNNFIFQKTLTQLLWETEYDNPFLDLQNRIEALSSYCLMM